MRNAFSLMELMIVIIILGLLSTLVLPNLVGQGEKAKRKLVCVQMKSLQDSLKMFRAELGRYPATEHGLKALIVNPDPELYSDYPSTPYIEEKTPPKDPWGTPYIYTNVEGIVELISLGADGKEGGSGDDADIFMSRCKK